MTARIFACFVTLGFLYLLNDSRLLAAQDTSPPEVENSQYQCVGVVNSNAVFVRSGPSENDYATIKLDKGAEVTGVGEKFDWVKIVPPEGSFCYVAKAYVDRRGNGSVGRVTNTLNVRVGSALNELKAKIATKLEPGADVQILGEEQEYFKIKPPAGVFFYINKQYVDPVRKIEVGADGKDAAAPAVTAVPEAPRETTAAKAEPGGVADSKPVAPVENSELENSTPTVPLAKAAVTPSTQPTADAEAEFERLENAYAQMSLKPLEEQPVGEILDGYLKLAGGEGLPESLRRIAEFKAQVLKTRFEAKEQLTQVRHVQDDMKQKQMALNAEREELEQRIKQSEIKFFSAVGTLRPSSLQQGEQTLFRLTDPANGRTVVYLRSADQKLGAMIGQFIGVKGDVSDDPQLGLKVISATTHELVNPSKVGQSIAAQIVPPSLLPGGAQANTNSNE